MAHWSNAALAAILLFAPLSAANTVIHESTPLAVMYVPQLHCDVVWDTAGPETCHAEGKVGLVTTMKVRIVGNVVAHGYVDKDRPGSVVRDQVGQFHCTITCSVPFYGGYAEGYLYLHVTSPTTGAKGSVLSVSLESDPASLPIS